MRFAKTAWCLTVCRNDVFWGFAVVSLMWILPLRVTFDGIGIWELLKDGRFLCFVVFLSYFCIG